MYFSTLLDAVFLDPLDYLDCCCVHALGAFVMGYYQIDQSVRPIWEATTNSFTGPGAADASIRAYLNERSSGRAYYVLFERLRKSTALVSPREPELGPKAFESFIELIREPVLAGRHGLVFGEPTCDWMYNYHRGRAAARLHLLPELARIEAEAFDEFEAWLQVEQGFPETSWHCIIGTFWSEDSPRKFVELWDEWEQRRDLA